MRLPLDLPVSRQTGQLRLRIRRFRYQDEQCKQKTFAVQFPGTLDVHAQLTHRLTTLTLFVLDMSGRAGEHLLAHFRMSMSVDTLVRLAKKAVSSSIHIATSSQTRSRSGKLTPFPCRHSCKAGCSMSSCCCKVFSFRVSASRLFCISGSSGLSRLI